MTAIVVSKGYSREIDYCRKKREENREENKKGGPERKWRKCESVPSRRLGGKTDSLTFLNIMKNVRVAKPSSPTDNAGISASNLSTAVFRPMLTNDKSTTARGDGSDISVRN